MGNFRILLAAIAALTLVFSIFSSVSPNNFAGLNAYAERNEERDTVNSGSTSGSDDEHDVQEHSTAKLQTEDNAIQIQVELSGLNMTNGSYNATFVCEEPAFSVTLDNAFKVEDGQGKLRAQLGLANHTYSGCELVMAGTNAVLASFDSFTVKEQAVNDDDVQEKRKEKMERIASAVSGLQIHERHHKAHSESPGDYKPNLNYMLTANGTAMHNKTRTDSALDINMTVWKSNHALIIFDVLGGTIHVGDHSYKVVLGYALFSVNHDAMRIASLAVDENGNVVKLKLHGSASDEESKLPMGSGSINLTFEGSSGPGNYRHGDSELELEGTITAQ